MLILQYMYSLIYYQIGTLWIKGLEKSYDTMPKNLPVNLHAYEFRMNYAILLLYTCPYKICAYL